MQSIRHTNGSQARVESHKVISVVSSDVDILAAHVDERSHKEIPKGTSIVRGLQKTSAGPSKCDHDVVEKSR